MSERVLAVARQEAHAQVSSGHLLLGLLHPDGGNLLRRIGLTVGLDGLREHVRVLTAGPSDPHSRLSDRVKRVLTDHLSPRDMLTALLDDPESTAARALVRAGQDLAGLRRRVREMPNTGRASRHMSQAYHPPPPEIRRQP
ncbi:Clp protease N-terminal domain-containing protein [Kutzneria chonburiensis]|uniref:Clp protease N-terminal domain-containing protein n=1 Tax=Kutzneria chonburiensis TaxID=1483604 RepID=A0ABV6N348_9PSEU|nr:Clp protease N-terminal domain-containing protein [Kutzneria chonburiensis]